jgi:hypothetical protein
VVARLVQIAMNARDDSALGRFWAEALGWSFSSEEPGVTSLVPVGFIFPDHVAVCIDIIVVPEPKRVKNRVYIGLATTSAARQATLVARRLGFGAMLADVGQGDVRWTVLSDPEGNASGALIVGQRQGLPGQVTARAWSSACDRSGSAPAPSFSGCRAHAWASSPSAYDPATRPGAGDGHPQLATGHGGQQVPVLEDSR